MNEHNTITTERESELQAEILADLGRTIGAHGAWADGGDAKTRERIALEWYDACAEGTNPASWAESWLEAGVCFPGVAEKARDAKIRPGQYKEEAHRRWVDEREDVGDEWKQEAIVDALIENKAE